MVVGSLWHKNDLKYDYQCLRPMRDHQLRNFLVHPLNFGPTVWLPLSSLTKPLSTEASAHRPQ